MKKKPFRILLPTMLFLLVWTISCNSELTNITVPVSYEEQLEKDIKSIDEFLAGNEINAVQHESGLRYVVLSEGSGDVPNSNSEVSVKYEGRFFSGGVFDSSTTGATFFLSQLISAWRIAIPLMKEGGVLTIYAPSGLCYGTAGISGIPPNTNLIFDIELIDVVQ